MKNDKKQVYLLSHWDDGVCGVYNKLNDAKNKVRWLKESTYKGFYKNKWGGWSYYYGGYEIYKMSESEAEVLFRFN